MSGRRASRASPASSTLLDELGGAASTTGPADAARGSPRAVGLPGRAGGRAHRRGGGPDREPGRAGRRRPASSSPVDDVPRADRAGRRHRRARRRRLVGDADDAALGEGPRVPGRVPHRAGGRRLPPPPLDRASPTSSRRSAASRTSASPGPASGSTSATPGAARSTGRRSTTRPAGSSTRSRPSWCRWSRAGSRPRTSIDPRPLPIRRGRPP